MSTKISKMETRRNRKGIFFVSPYFLIYCVFGLVPILYTLYLSFTNWDGFSTPTFVGLDNYTRLLQDDLFFKSVGNTFIIWLCSIIPQLILALVLAIILNEKFIKGKNFFRATYYFPNIITPVTVGLLFALLFDWQTGTVNKILLDLHIIDDPVNWLKNPIWSRLIISFLMCWQYFGYNMLFFLAGLQGIPSSVYEAAQVDGANKFQTTIKVTLPLLKPVLVFVGLTSIIGGLQLFDQAMMMGTGPENSTLTMVMYLYNTAFKNFDYGYGSAIAYGIFVIILLATVITQILTKIMRRRSEG
ncbi:carbohydrate ABC transporter permease [Listeria costaricensis]|uniref:carbohydrate ABC transporter permease n=1 Tax=Listeria costaricensis TaxID=2026604 RepID=UPI000C068900|nr:sugar ABC transporter permease [Listeria costaricensis]